MLHGRSQRMMSLIMLLLLALPGFGVTSIVSRSVLGNVRQAETEENEERVHCSSQRRVRKLRSPNGRLTMVGCLRAETHAALVVRALMISSDDHPLPSGHRFQYESLAPMRC